MKSRSILSSFFSFGYFLSLFFVFGCGDTEDRPEVTNSTYNTFLDEPDEQWLQPTDEDWEKLKDAEQWLQLTDEDWKKLKDEDWKKLKDEDWVRLTDAEVEELIDLKIPRWNGEQIAWEKAMKHSHARLFQKFGDIPQVRYMVEYDRMSRGGIVTLEFAKQRLAYWAANYFLFPNADNQRTLEDTRNRLKAIAEREELHLLEKLRIEDSEAWVKGIRAFLIRRHGNIPETDVIIEFLRKLEWELPRTDKECRTYLRVYETLYDHINTASTYESYAWLEAVNQIGHFVGDAPRRRLEKYREARAEGISFHDIEWDD